MVSIGRFAALTFAAAVTVSAAPATSYHACYADGERAIGADGYPAVDYLPCCSGKPPLPMDPSAHGYDATTRWGLFCGGTGKVIVAEQCYNDGERAIGAPGYEAVPYKPCCNGREPKAVAYDWGKFCGGEDLEPVEDDTGFTRCAGEEGFPYVEYVDCGAEFKCEKMPEYSWGFFCVAVGESDCYRPGERAIGARGYPAIQYLPCCDGMEPIQVAYNWGYFCPAAGASPAVTPGPRCVTAGMKCDSYGPRCCGSTECTPSGLGYNSCQEVLMATPAPTCVSSGEKCHPNGRRCCGSAKCSASGYAHTCEEALTATPAPTCVLGGGVCDMKGTSCCDGFECTSSSGYRSGLSCTAIVTAIPLTTTVMPSPDWEY